MLNLLDVLMRDLFLGGLPGAVPGIPGFVQDAQVRFQPPDGTLRTDVVNLNRQVLSVYLVDLRENRKLRSNERTPSLDVHRNVVTDPAHARVDCHYLVTAWTPTQAAPGVEPTVEEHALLYRAFALLVLAGSLNPSRMYATGSAKLNAWPEPFRRGDLPAVALPVEGFAKLSEFWTTMGQNSPWRPAAYYIVTVPVALLREIAGPMVTTSITEYRQDGAPESAEVRIWIGGHVWNTAVPLPDGSPSPIEGAWVHLEDPGGALLQHSSTDGLGRFTFDHLSRGSYVLRTGAVGFGPKSRAVTVPSETGEYDFRFP